MKYNFINIHAPNIFGFIYIYKVFIMLSSYKGLAWKHQWRFQPCWEDSIGIGLSFVCFLKHCKHFGFTWIKDFNQVVFIFNRDRLFPSCPIKIHVNMLSYPFVKLKANLVCLNWEVHKEEEEEKIEASLYLIFEDASY